MMYSIKGGWGKTFALAKHNESEGKKSRTRRFRSKEERKTMVEVFIKKYQQSNNGNFPSLNLTHKEVGGSFYTVREIVRDIIQENRVLGPAKFTSEELNSDNFFEQNPLGSIARDLQPFINASSNENHLEINKLQDRNSKLFSVSDGSHTEAEHQVIDQEHVINVGQVDVTNKELIEVTVVSDGYDTGAEHPMVDKGHAMNISQMDEKNNGSVEATVVSERCCTGAEHKIVDKTHVLNGSQVDMINKESNEATIPEMQVNDPMALKQNAEQELAAATEPMAEVTAMTEDLMVETFPLRPVSRTVEGIEGLGELKNLNDSPENDIKMLELTLGEEKSELNGIESTKTSNLLDEKFEDTPGNQIFKNISSAGLDKEENVEDMLAKRANHSTDKEHFGHEFEDRTDPETLTSETINQSQMIDGAESSTQTKNLRKAYKPLDEEGPQIAKKHKVDDQFGGNSQGSSTTVDRISLESWDGTARNPAKQEPNPLIAVLEAVVRAFVKFWSG